MKAEWEDMKSKLARKEMECRTLERKLEQLEKEMAECRLDRDRYTVSFFLLPKWLTRYPSSVPHEASSAYNTFSPFCSPWGESMNKKCDNSERWRKRLKKSLLLVRSSKRSSRMWRRKWNSKTTSTEKWVLRGEEPNLCVFKVSKCFS